ncbi:MAG: ferritin family protein [Planctomycetota bacterium]|jgi:rubrerythrin|nr:ferritin family protein [Planctomycetota bacterium]
METKFNVFETLQIAEQIEHRGAKFYLKTAELFADPERRDIYYKLANWKARHEKVIAQRRKRFSEKTGQFGTFDPDNYVLSNPHVMAGLTGFGIKRDTFRGFTGRESKEEIIRDAIRRENEAIIFYQGLKDFTRDQTTRDTIDKVIKEESRHIRTLTELLERQ